MQSVATLREITTKDLNVAAGDCPSSGPNEHNEHNFELLWPSELVRECFVTYFT